MQELVERMSLKFQKRDLKELIFTDIKILTLTKIFLIYWKDVTDFIYIYIFILPEHMSVNRVSFMYNIYHIYKISVFQLSIIYISLPGGASGKQFACQCRQEMLVPSLGWEDSLGEGMVTHSNILTQKNPWTDGPGGLQSIGLQNQT